jgi:hypothetical protein
VPQVVEHLLSKLKADANPSITHKKKKVSYYLELENRSDCWEPVAHTCNPSYSGVRDQEDRSLKPLQANSMRPHLKTTHHKNRASGVAQGVSP